MARLDRLGAAKEVAQIGAAIGREFSHALRRNSSSSSSSRPTSAVRTPGCIASKRLATELARSKTPEVGGLFHHVLAREIVPALAKLQPNQSRETALCVPDRYPPDVRGQLFGKELPRYAGNIAWRVWPSRWPISTLSCITGVWMGPNLGSVKIS
jgi:hypothetical protein